MADVKKDKDDAKLTGTVQDREQKIAALQAEIVELQKPIPQPYPKWKYSPDEPAQLVNDGGAEKALGPGWYDTPEDFPDAKAAKDAKAKAAKEK